jgi:hypothetical protein
MSILRRPTPLTPLTPLISSRPPPSQVLGVDILRSKDVRATHRLIVDHIARVRTLPRLSHATCVLLLESNLA